MGHVLAVVSSLVRACSFIPAAWSGQSCDMMFLKSTKAHTELVLFGVSVPLSWSCHCWMPRTICSVAAVRPFLLLTWAETASMLTWQSWGT